MSLVCEICKKGKVVGRSHTHKRGVAGKRWRKRTQVTPKVFYPNLQLKTLEIDGVKRQMKICTKCLKRIKKFKSIGEFKNISIV